MTFRFRPRPSPCHDLGLGRAGYELDRGPSRGSKQGRGQPAIRAGPGLGNEQEVRAGMESTCSPCPDPSPGPGPVAQALAKSLADASSGPGPVHALIPGPTLPYVQGSGHGPTLPKAQAPGTSLLNIRLRPDPIPALTPSSGKYPVPALTPSSGST